MRSKVIQFTSNILHMAFMLPAMIFWAIFLYAGHSLLGFFALSSFFLEKYKKAEEAAKVTFCNGITAVTLGFVIFMAFIMFLLSLGGENDKKNTD